MKIKIATKLQPFSHSPGIYCLLPGTSWRVQCFPTLIRVEDVSQALPRLIQEIALPVQGSMREFTVKVDLERGTIQIWGHSADKFHRYTLTRNAAGDGIDVNGSHKLSLQIPIERLSLGSHKQQEWDLVLRRSNLTEIFPHWYHLGHITPSPANTKREGTASLLEGCHESILSNAPESIFPAFHSLFLAGFQGILTPRLFDNQYQGIIHPPLLDEKASPLLLLTEGAKLIRRLFIQQEGSLIKILPALPPECYCGRFLRVSLGEWGFLDFEWTKKKIRRAIFYAEATGEVSFKFKHVRSFRWQQDSLKRGERINADSAIKVEKSQVYLLDNFE